MKKVLLVLSIAVGAQASKRIEVKAKGSGSNSSFGVGYEYSDENMWTTNISFTSTRSKVKDSVTGETEINRDLQWVNSLDFKNSWYLDITLGGSRTKVDEISTGNFDATTGQTLKDFFAFNWGITAGVNTIKQQEAFNTNPKLALIQNKSGFQLGAKPMEWMNFSVFFNQYKYDKDVDTQLSRLSNPAAIQQYGTAFSESLSTLIDHESGFSLAFYMAEDWSLKMTFANSEDAPQPKVKGKSFDLKLDHQMSSEWDASILAGSTQYESTATTPSSKYGYLGFLVGVSF